MPKCAGSDAYLVVVRSLRGSSIGLPLIEAVGAKQVSYSLRVDFSRRVPLESSPDPACWTADPAPSVWFSHWRGRDYNPPPPFIPRSPLTALSPSCVRLPAQSDEPTFDHSRRQS